MVQPRPQILATCIDDMIVHEFCEETTAIMMSDLEQALPRMYRLGDKPSEQGWDDRFLTDSELLSNSIVFL